MNKFVLLILLPLFFISCEKESKKTIEYKTTQKWEYKTLFDYEVKFAVLEKQKDGTFVTPKQVQLEYGKILNQLGSEGWEIITSREGSGIIFKRPL